MTDEQDFTDPEYVLGAVLAQLEDLAPADKRRVLYAAVRAVTDGSETRHRIFTGVLPDGREALVQLWDGVHAHAELAFRDRPDTAIVWGPPTSLVERDARR